MGEGQHCYYREMSQATGAKKPEGESKSESPWRMKAAWDRGEEYYDPARKGDILGRTKNPPRFVGRTSQRPDVGPGKKHWNAVKIWLLVRSLLLPVVVVAMALQCCGRGDVARDVGKALLGRRLASPGSLGRCPFAHIIQRLECLGDVWATAPFLRACRLALDCGRRKRRRGMSCPWSLGRMGSVLPKESDVGEWRRSLVGRRKCVFQWLSRRQRGQRTLRCTSSGCMGW